MKFQICSLQFNLISSLKLRVEYYKIIYN